MKILHDFTKAKFYFNFPQLLEKATLKCEKIKINAEYVNFILV